MATMIGQLHSVVIDAPDPHALATFYAGVLGMEIKGSPGEDWITITGAGYRIAFQQAPDLQSPHWPDPDRPQQFHLDCDTRVRDLHERGPPQSDLRKRLPWFAIVCRGFPTSCAMAVPSAPVGLCTQNIGRPRPVLEHRTGP
jgi:hypothetical protein